MRILVAAFALALAAYSQTFDVATIKSAGSAMVRLTAGSGPVRSPYLSPTYSGTRFSCRLPLGGILQEAFSMRRWQVEGPSWLDQELFEVNAVMPENTSREKGRLMLRLLLEERFGLRAHLDKRVLPVYSLGLGAAPHKLGPAEQPFRSEQRPESYSTTSGTLQSLADFLTSVSDRPVVDETGLTGSFSMRFTWSQDFTNQEESVKDARRERIFAAVARELGLKIAARKAPVDMLVIDHVERQPTAN